MRRYPSPAGLRRLGAAAVAAGIILAGPVPAARAAETPFLSEIHYDNAGADSGEAIEIQAPAGADLTGWRIVLYNGSTGTAYHTATLSGVVPAAGVVVRAYPADGIQNGAPDGVALADPSGAVTEFLTYEGTFTAADGPAAGRTGVDLGVAESGTTPAGSSLQKVDGRWTGPAANSFGTRNTGAAEPGPEPAPGCTAPVDHTIAQVQGTGAATGLAGTRVTVEGVVTADHRTGGYNGVYVQTAGSGGDRPVAAGTASDGIFVYLGADAAQHPAVAVGDLVRVGGTPSEFGGFTELSTAAKADVQVCAHDTALPAPVPLRLPLADDARESAESMLVAPAGTYAVSDVFNANRFGELVLAAGGAPARVPTDVARPGTAAATQVKDANRLGRILLDDARTVNLATAGLAPAYLTRDDPVRVGDTVESFAPAVLGYGFAEWRLQPVTPAAAALTTFTDVHARTAAPAGVGGDLRLASFNVLNYFVHFGGEARGADDAAALARQQAKIVAAITALHADVVALMEIENSVKFDAGDPQLALKTLVGALNAADGAGTWDYVRTPADLPGAAQQDVITAAIIYRPAKVTPQGASRSINDESVWSNAREPIAQTFAAGSITFTVIANHFKSKSAGVPPSGDNLDTGDGQGPYNGDRVRQANSLAAFADRLTAAGGSDKVLLLGDFNSYTREDPLQALYDRGWTDVHTTRAPGAYSYVFGGETGSLDHALATGPLAERVTGVDIWNINSVESFAYEYDGYAPFYTPGPYRASDHDPVVVGLYTGPIGYTLDRTEIWATQSATLRLAPPPGATALSVDWGDATTSTLPPDATTATHAYLQAGTFTVQVTAGAAGPVTAGSVRVSLDTDGPVVAFTAPRHPGAASSWATLTGTATDQGVGVARVGVTLIEQRSLRWYYYTGHTWLPATSKAAAQAAAPVLAVTPSAGAWSLPVTGLTRGALTLTYRADDLAGNRTTGNTRTQRIIRP